MTGISGGRGFYPDPDPDPDPDRLLDPRPYKIYVTQTGWIVRSLRRKIMDIHRMYRCLMSRVMRGH